MKIDWTDVGVIEDVPVMGARVVRSAQGDIAVIKLGNLSGATILAGLTAVPEELGDFASGRTIGSFTVTGSMSDSVVASARFNSIILGNVDAAAGLEAKGIFADAIKSYLRKSLPSAKLTNLDVAGTFDASLNYAVNIF